MSEAAALLVHRMETISNKAKHGKGTLVQTDAQVQSFRQARQARRVELVEDYVELIADLIEETGEARQVDIAARLGVAQPTVAKMLKRLVGDGLILQRPYRGVFLTEAGRQLAEKSRARHEVVESLLCALGVSAETARLDAEGIEHHVSTETLEAFQRFLRQSPGLSSARTARLGSAGKRRKSRTELGSVS